VRRIDPQNRNGSRSGRGESGFGTGASLIYSSGHGRVLEGAGFCTTVLATGSQPNVHVSVLFRGRYLGRGSCRYTMLSILRVDMIRVIRQVLPDERASPLAGAG